jgi:hypothetical protein
MKFLAGAVYQRRILMMLLATATAYGGPSLSAPKNEAKQAKASGSPRAAAESSLRLMAEKISKAVLDKDIPTLLTYDRADLRSNDEVSLQNPKGDLYCYIFDSDCITWGDGSWRSVYDKLSQAHPLEIKAQVARSPADRQLYGSLLFYDGSSVSEKDLQSSDFLCKEAPAKIASWKFRLEKGKWKSVTPLFDAETEALCPH